MDPYADPDPAIFVIDLQDANKKLIIKGFSVFYFLKVHLHNFSKIKSQEAKKTCGSGGSGSGPPSSCSPTSPYRFLEELEEFSRMFQTPLPICTGETYRTRVGVLPVSNMSNTCLSVTHYWLEKG
jgi:hypothetical protein